MSVAAALQKSLQLANEANGKESICLQFPSSSLGEALNFEEAHVDTSQLTSGQHVIQNRGTAEHKTDPTV